MILSDNILVRHDGLKCLDNKGVCNIIWFYVPDSNYTRLKKSNGRPDEMFFDVNNINSGYKLFPEVGTIDVLRLNELFETNHLTLLDFLQNMNEKYLIFK